MWMSGPKLRQPPDGCRSLEVNPLKTAIAIVALLASIFLPSAAAAETVVPPGNSAATQYTEAFPTAGGNAVNNSGIDGGRGGSSPSKVLGHDNAKQLESKGEVGREVADLAAETSPQQSGAAGTAGGGAGAGVEGHDATGGNGGKSGNGVGWQGGGELPSQHQIGASKAGDGSSGLGEVVGQATGSSSGQLGLLLPLIVLGTVLWAAAYTWRRRRRLAH